MKIVIIGAGAMGASYGALLAAAGQEVCLVDIWVEHVEAIARDGVRVDTPEGTRRQPIEIGTEPPASCDADLVVVFVDSNATREVCPRIEGLLGPEGFAITFQNGVGNVEALVESLGPGRVAGGSSMCSAAVRGPGHVALTHLGATSIGELDGTRSTRIAALAEALDAAGFETRIEDDIRAKIWNKFVLNCSIDALCATTGLRMGEIARLPEMDALQDRVIDEALEVTRAKGIALPDQDIRATIKKQSRSKFSRPSMLQHMEAARRTEIDAINGALVREARALGIATPYNEALVALLKGRELKRRRESADPGLDYEAWEARVAAGDDS